MTAKVNHMKAEARAKISRLKCSPRYRSFLTAETVDAFCKVEESALAGKSVRTRMSNGPAPRA